MHCTVDAMKNTLAGFSSPDPDTPVSSHSIMTENEPSHALPGGVIIGMVSENKVAFHAGISSWQGAEGINKTSIGIENINRTNLFNANNGPYDPHAQRTFVPFDEHQIKVLGTLAQSIIKTYAIKPDAVVGHSDISFHRDNGTDKIDPGGPVSMERRV
jgi:N-acetylmuramoyl-L-alanine amidase